MDMLKLHGIGGAPIRATEQLILTSGATDIIKPGGNYLKGFIVKAIKMEPGDLPININNCGYQDYRSLTDYTKCIETIITGISGTVRVKFHIRNFYNGYDTYGRIYKNGVPVGIERHLHDDAEGTFSEDISFLSGDAIQIYARVLGGEVKVDELGLYCKPLLGNYSNTSI